MIFHSYVSLPEGKYEYGFDNLLNIIPEMEDRLLDRAIDVVLPRRWFRSEFSIWVCSWGYTRGQKHGYNML